MRPGTPHLVLTFEDCLAVGGHFYSTATYELSLKSIMHEFYAGTVITNTHLPTAPIYLLKTLSYYHSWMESLGDDSWKEKFAPRFDARRLAALLVCCWYVPELPPMLPPILQSQKTAEEKWHKSAEHKHDAWRAAALAVHLLDVHGEDVRVASSHVEKRLLHSASFVREELGKRLRLPVLEKVLRPFVDSVVFTSIEDLPDGAEEVATDGHSEDAGGLDMLDDVEMDELSEDEDAEGIDESGRDSDATTPDVLPMAAGEPTPSAPVVHAELTVLVGASQDMDTED